MLLCLQLPDPSGGRLSQAVLDSMNIEQQKEDNRKNLDELGGIEGLIKLVGVDPVNGWSKEQVVAMRNKYGLNSFPETPLDSYFKLLLEALSDSILLILIAASSVSLVIGVLTHPDNGWIEAVAIFIAIFLVSNISAGMNLKKIAQVIDLIDLIFYECLQAMITRSSCSSGLWSSRALRTTDPQSCEEGQWSASTPRRSSWEM